MTEAGWNNLQHASRRRLRFIRFTAARHACTGTLRQELQQMRCLTVLRVRRSIFDSRRIIAGLCTHESRRRTAIERCTVAAATPDVVLWVHARDCFERGCMYPQVGSHKRVPVDRSKASLHSHRRARRVNYVLLTTLINDRTGR